MHVAEIWRYPVKSMAGEQLEQAIVTSQGIAGDRIVHVEDAYGRVATARTYPQLLGNRAVLKSSGEPNVNGASWTDPALLRRVHQIVGPGSRLVHDESAARFDVLPLLVATDGASAAFGHDPRRLRPNLIIGGVEGLAERLWPGKVLAIRDVLIGVQDLRGRCVMTTFHPDTLAQNPEVLREIVRKFEGQLALNCYIVHSGVVRVGDQVTLVDAQESQEDGLGLDALGAHQGTGEPRWMK